MPKYCVLVEFDSDLPEDSVVEDLIETLTFDCVGFTNVNALNVDDFSDDIQIRQLRGEL